MKSSEIWLAARELGGWAEAGGVKDVVRDQAAAFVALGWTCRVALPLYGFLRVRVLAEGKQLWSGRSAHPEFGVAVEVWSVYDQGFEVLFFHTPALASKASLYTYTAEEEASDSRYVKGQGYEDAFAMNLEFQWAVATYGAQSPPGYVLAHDGHAGFLPAIARTRFGARFGATVFALVVHNAGTGYRQEMPATDENARLLGLSAEESAAAVLEAFFEPVVSAARHARLATVSENYAEELKTGRNDHWSGPLGPWLRSSRTRLVGITNGLSTADKDPRDAASAGLPASFDPGRGDWAGKVACREALRLVLASGWSASSVTGTIKNWDGALYVLQGRLTQQKGIDAAAELIERALAEKSAAFVVMGQGERRFEERLSRLADGSDRFVFINTYEDRVAKLVFASGDFFLMPSEYEPCGLTDLKAQLMGTLPIVHRVGGLVKVLDGVTGFSYEDDFWDAFERSLALWRRGPEALSSLRRQAFERVLRDFDWVRILRERYVPWLTGSSPIPILSPTAPT